MMPSKIIKNKAGYCLTARYCCFIQAERIKSVQLFETRCARGGKKQLYGVEKRIRIYKGQYFDQETGLHYNYHRYYDPSLGRYLKPDPSHSLNPEEIDIPYMVPFILDEPLEFNVYNYVQNDPINWIDPYGLAKTSMQAAIENCLKSPTTAAKIKCLEDLLGIVCDKKNIKRINQNLRSLRNKKKGSGGRQKTGQREKNRGHKDGEEHSKRPKGGFRR